MQNLEGQTQCPKILKTSKFKNKWLSSSCRSLPRTTERQTLTTITSANRCEKPKSHELSAGELRDQATFTSPSQTAHQFKKPSNVIKRKNYYLQHTATDY